VGDQLQIEAANRLRYLVLETDPVARIGGDELVVLLEGLGKKREHSAACAQSIADKIRMVLSETYLLAEIRRQGSVSVGTAVFQGSQHDPLREPAQSRNNPLRHPDPTCPRGCDAPARSRPVPGEVDAGPDLEVGVQEPRLVPVELDLGIVHDG